MRCPSCTAEISDHWATCPICGSVAGGVPWSAPSSTAPASRLDQAAAEPSRPDSAPRFLTGELLADRYRIGQLLGRGGMGEVYRADDLKLDQSVALKFLSQSVEADPAELAWFLEEVKVARQVTHPNVCRVFDIGEASGSHFLSMEHVQGEDLSSRLRRLGRQAGEEALEIGRQLCAGLEAMHDRGILHRDLKPSNVMLDEDGHLRLTDFGLAASAGASRRGGTPAYMAPEVWQGRPESVQSDLYALGLVLYEVVTGKKAFRASSIAEMGWMHAETVPVPPSDHVPDTGAHVERVILACLEKAPDRRPASARAVAEGLAGRGNQQSGGQQSGGQRAGVTLPPSMPLPRRDFTGRRRELAELRARVGEHGGALIYGLRGLGGVGKTELALKLAAEVGSEYPDGHLLIELGGASDRPLPPAEALAQAIRAFEPRSQLPDSVTELRQIWQTVLRHRRVLLLLDDAASAEQVEPLLPHAGCLTMVTSRYRFALPQLHRQDLDALTPEAARELLLSLAPRLGAAAGELAELLGRLPLALRLAGSAFAERPDLEAAEYNAKFRHRDRRLELVDVAIGFNYGTLGAELRRRWRSLAVFPGGFDAAGAAAVWATQPATAREILGGGLLQVSLVDWSGGRYRLHQLARDFAAARLHDEERRAAERRHAGHYAGVLAAANRLYLEGAEKVLAGLALFDREWANIRAGQAWAAARAADDAEAARYCSAYPGAGPHCLNLRLHPRAWVAWLEAGRSAAATLGDRQKEGHHVGNLGNAYVLLGEPRRAVECYRQHLAISREIGDRRSEGSCLANLGLAHGDLGEPRRAIDYYQRSVAIARETGDRRGEGIMVGDLGIIYADLGEPRRAAGYLEQQLEITREIGDRGGEGRALAGLGCATGDLRQAVDYYRQALTIFRELGDRRSEGNVLADLGLACAALGRPRRAVEIHERSLAIVRKVGDRLGEGHGLRHLGLARAALGEARRAVDCFEQSLAIAREIGDRRGEALAAWHLGAEHEKQGDFEQAAELMRVCVDFKQEIGHAEAEQDAARVAEIQARLLERAAGPVEG